MIKNKVKDKLSRFIHALIDVMGAVTAVIWMAIEPGMLRRYFPEWTCTLAFIIVIAGLVIFLINLYDAWDELAQARKECEYGKDI